MAEENEKKQEENGAPEAEATEQAPEAGAEEAPAADQASEAAEPDAPAEDSAEPAGDPAEPDAPAEDSAGPDEELSPKQRRKLERSRAGGPAGPGRSVEERATERAERRRKAASECSRHRKRSRDRHDDAGTGTPPADRLPGVRKIRQGTVVSSAAAKTITVRIERARRDPAYEKVVRRSNTLHVHDERDEANDGDVVRVVETRPLSKTKRWRLLEIVERAR